MSDILQKSPVIIAAALKILVFKYILIVLTELQFFKLLIWCKNMVCRFTYTLIEFIIELQ